MVGRSGTRSQHGFTLSELLVVISVIAVLAGVVVFAVGGISDRGQTSACSSDARVLRTAEESRFAQTGKYATEQALVDAGLLSKPSTLHDVMLSGNTYTLTALGDCATSGNALPPGVAVHDGGPAGVTVELLSSTSNKLAGGVAEYSKDSWASVGTTGTDGRTTAKLSDGDYHFRLDYRGSSLDTGSISVSSGTVITFTTARLTVQLENGNNGGYRTGAIAVRGNDGYWMTVDDTDEKGTSTAELLPGEYEPRIDYFGATSVLSKLTLSESTTVPVALVPTTVHTTPGSEVAHRGNNGVWTIDTTVDGGGTTTIDLLAGTYDIRSTLKIAHVRSDVVVSGSGTDVKIG